MTNILNRRISSIVGIVIVLLIAGLASWLIIRGYKQLIEIRFAPLEYVSEERTN